MLFKMYSVSTKAYFWAIAIAVLINKTVRNNTGFFIIPGFKKLLLESYRISSNIIPKYDFLPAGKGLKILSHDKMEFTAVMQFGITGLRVETVSPVHTKHPDNRQEGAYTDPHRSPQAERIKLL